MSPLGIPDCFVEWIRLLFIRAKVTIHLNGQTTASFPIERGMYQGCPLAPYLFLFIGEALNIATKQAMELRNLKGIYLPHEVGQQIILQYVDDTNFTLTCMAQNLLNAASLLDLFHLVSGLIINWNKSVAYLLALTLLPAWLTPLRFTWAVEHQLSKLLP
jgi:hypothetical protein